MDILGKSIGDTVFFGNTLVAYVIAFGIFVALLFVFKFVQIVILRYLKKLSEKTKTDIDDTLVRIVGLVRPPFYSFFAFYCSLFFLNVSDGIQEVADGVLLVWVVYQIILALQILVGYIIQKYFADDDDTAEQGIVGFMGGLVNASLWIVGVLLVLSNLGINITSLVAGLGIGGLAIAFALQKIFADLFSSFAIYLDKPFAVGDFILVGNHMGTVQKIGIKTTRIKAAQGEEIVIPNQELTGARVQNFKKMKERRTAFKIGVTYDTSTEKMKLIPGMIKKIVETKKGVRFDRAHFVEFGDFALMYEVVYFVESSDYVMFRDVHEKIGFEIKEVFERNGIDFAFPTQTIYIEKDK